MQLEISMWNITPGALGKRRFLKGGIFSILAWATTKLWEKAWQGSEQTICKVIIAIFLQSLAIPFFSSV